MFEGQVDSPKRLNILYVEVERNYHVIAKLTGDMAKEHCVKDAARRVNATSRTSATRRVAIALSVRHAHSRSFESPATTAIGTLETPRVSRTTSCSHRMGNHVRNVSDVARRADGSRRAKSTNVSKVSVTPVRRTKE